MLNGISTARLTLRNPPAVMTLRSRVSPACAPSAAPTYCDSEVGMVATRINSAPESAGANTARMSLNRGVLPHEMFMEQTRSFAAEVLPALDVHRVEQVPLADDVAAWAAALPGTCLSNLARHCGLRRLHYGFDDVRADFLSHLAAGDG